MTADPSQPEVEPRYVSGPLMVGLVSLPAVFVWLLFRRGYSRSLRRIVLIYAFGPSLIALILIIALALLSSALR
ncbi:hypothetical protein ACLB0R_02680 [Sphingomonas sp. GlSt437]|uniref:hypothetical protein n=1 Tax=Sphingomonas sp. GlSt437 TaxID=3389970 RepID=UPI003A885599